jgi:hypothetical protein
VTPTRVLVFPCRTLLTRSALPVSALWPHSLLFTAARLLYKVTTAVRVCCYVRWHNLPYTCLCWFCLNLSVTHKLTFHSVEILCVISALRTSVCTHFQAYSYYMPTYIKCFYFPEVRVTLMASRNKADRYRLRCQMYGRSHINCWLFINYFIQTSVFFHIL